MKYTYAAFLSTPSYYNLIIAKKWAFTTCARIRAVHKLVRFNLGSWLNAKFLRISKLIFKINNSKYSHYLVLDKLFYYNLNKFRNKCTIQKNLRNNVYWILKYNNIG